MSTFFIIVSTLALELTYGDLWSVVEEKYIFPSSGGKGIRTLLYKPHLYLKISLLHLVLMNLFNILLHLLVLSCSAQQNPPSTSQFLDPQKPLKIALSILVGI